MFWRFGGYSNISTIDTLLDKPSLKLEDLLEESDLIQELKSHHTKLIEYLRDDQNLHRLLGYVTAPGPPVKDEDVDEDDNDNESEKEKSAAKADQKQGEEQEKAEKRRLKYAYVACEILASETWSITESVVANQAYLIEFWEFLRRPLPLDPLQAGYFTKVNETLLEKKTEDMLDFFKSLPNIVPTILQHVDCPMIMDLLLKIISMEKAEGGTGIVDWLLSQNLIPILLSNLSAENNSSAQTSAGDFLKAIITISANAAQNEQSCIGPNSLTRQLVSQPCIESLISSMLRGGNPLTVGVGIVIEVIRKNNSDYDPENGLGTDSPPTNHDPIYLGTLLRMFAKHVPDFMDLILSSKHTITESEKTKVVERGHLKSAWGTKIEPLGFDRFKTCELMAELLHCSNMGLLNEPGSEEMIRERDAIRERLRSQGAFSTLKPAEDSTVDLSAASSRFENSFNPSASNSTEELRIANSNEDDGFEKVALPSTESKDLSISTKLDDLDDLVDEPLSPRNAGSTSPKQTRANPLTPTTKNLNDNVRRLSLDDTTMSSPTSDAEAQPPKNDLSPHPEDRPAPLFAKAKDPNKTPTASSPEPPKTPKNTAPERTGSITVQMDVDHSHGDTILSEGSTHMPDHENVVVGDYLKIMFVKHQVVPTILNFFFRFPWNNFLHNVVYDVVQQVFNGLMERGFNKSLAFDLFETGRITEQIIEGQRQSDLAQQSKNMRLGYMGHLTLVAEEVVKFGERHPREILSPKVQEYVYGKPWEQYVTKTLADTRERDNAILGGFRPDNGLGTRQAVISAVSGGGFGMSSGLTSANLTAHQGMDSVDLSNNGSTTTAVSGGSFQSGFASSSDDEDEDMDDVDDDDQPTKGHISRTLGETTLNTEPENTDQPFPLLPPPPAPLNIEPSRLRKRFESRIAAHKKAQEEEEVAAEFGSESDDPFTKLDEHDDDIDVLGGAHHAFASDEEEQDITSFGKRNAGNSDTGGGEIGVKSPGGITDKPHHSSFTISRGITNLFGSSGSASGSSHLSHRRNDSSNGDDFEGSLDGSTSSDGGSGSDIETDHHHQQIPLEARTSLERKPLDIDDDDDDDDEEMGDMVAPTGGPNSSDEEVDPDADDDDGEVLSPLEKERLRGSFGAIDVDDQSGGSEFDGQQDVDDDEDDGGLVEIAMPGSVKRKVRS